MVVAMAGALGQIVIHDIIPTFYADSAADQQPERMQEMTPSALSADRAGSSQRGDLFSDESPAGEASTAPVQFYKTEQFVWTLKWTHIHLFGMNMIFFFIGGIAIFLDIGAKWRAWLVVLPFAGILIDIAVMWLKGYVSPAFFWLHLPGGGLFGSVFFFVSGRAFYEMWWMRKN